MRLIDADALMLHLADYELQESPYWGANGHGNETAYLTIKECEKAVEEQPTIDAVSVVRCKECKNCRPEGNTTRFYWCHYWNKPTDLERYCSDGEREDE